MNRSILINITRGETRVALLEDGQVAECYIEREKELSLVGNIYKGRVVKILPGMQSAFVDIGLDKSAFLFVGDIRTDILEDYTDLLDRDQAEGLEQLQKRRRHELHIDELIQEGQELLVQVSKDPIGGKGARVTSYATIPGRYLVVMPNVDHVGISRRIESEEERARLKSIVEQIRPADTGLIIRTASEGATEEELRSDFGFLTRLWENIIQKEARVGAPTLLYSDLDIVLRTVRDMLGQSLDQLIIDNEKEFRALRDFAETYFPKLADRIELYDGTDQIFDSFGIEVDLARALGRRVWLKSGGYIVLDQTEAMTVIDVNTGKFVGKEDLEDTILRTNIEAVKEIACQIRLRNLGGIIIVDFIDMERAENRTRVLNTFIEAMARDKAKKTISQISELGLVQMTRKRVRESMGRILCETCPYCEGKGFVKSAATLCYEIFRKVSKAAQSGTRSIVITAHPDVAELLSDEERQGLEEIEAKHNLKIIVTADQNLHQEKYDISSL